MQGLHRGAAERLVPAGGHQRRGLVARHLLGKTGAGEHPGVQPGSHLGGNLVAEQATAGFEALAQPHHGSACGQTGEHVAQAGHRCGHDEQAPVPAVLAGMGQRGAEVAADLEGFGQRQAGQVALVDAIAGDGTGLFGITGP